MVFNSTMNLALDKSWNLPVMIALRLLVRTVPEIIFLKQQVK